MKKFELQSRKIELSYKLAFYSVGLFVALVLALFNSQYAGEAFALVGGLMGGDALSSS